jgi:hypothetical protein
MGEHVRFRSEITIIPRTGPIFPRLRQPPGDFRRGAGAGCREAFAVHLDREGQAHSIVKFLNNLLLLADVVHFDPVPVWVAEIDLLDPIRPESNGARCALQVFVGDARLC